MEWKSLNLFSIVPSLYENRKNKLKSISAAISSYCYNPMFYVFCDVLGFVHIMKTSLEKPISFQSNKSPIRKCAISGSSSNLLVTLADVSNKDVLIQVFNITNIRLQRNTSLSAIAKIRLNIASTVSSLQISATNHGVSIALATQGELYFHQSPTASNLNFRIFSLSGTTINAVEFIGNKLLICTDTEVHSYSLTENGSIERKSILLDPKDTKNSNVECSSAGFLQNELYFLVGQKDVIFCFTSDGRGPCYCYAVEGEKKCVASYKNFLIIVAKKTGNLFPHNLQTVLIVLDVQNKLVVLEKTLDGISGILTNGSQCCVFTSCNELFFLQEHNMQVKVQLLLRKGLYDIALRFAELEVCDEEILANIFLKYGDYLFLKGNFDLAIDKYILTLGVIDPYIIIRKLLDSRLNTYLYKYLEALLKSGHAQNQHVKLLLKCNERLDLTANVEKYLNIGGLPEYCLHIDQISEKYRPKIILDMSFSAFVDIIEDGSLAYDFFSSMDEQKMYVFFTEHGRTLLQNFPNRVIYILKKLCFSDKPLIQSPERFIPLLLEHKDLCLEFLNDMIKSGSDINTGVYNMLFALQLQLKSYDETQPHQLVRLLDSHVGRINETHVLLLCKIYTFLPGIKLLSKRLTRKNLLSPKALWPNIFFQLIATTECHVSETITPIGKASYNDKPSKKINYFIEEMGSSGKCLLEIMHCIFKHKGVTVGQVNDVFKQRNTKSSTSNFNSVSKLFKEVKSLNKIIHNYLFNPIEFRINVCNICRQEIHLPVIFLLCQHVFHKECVNSYSPNESCIVCSSSSYRPLCQDASVTIMSDYFSIEKISNMLAENYFKSLQNYVKLQNIISIILSEYSTSNSLNPFEENVECSWNRNPFEKGDISYSNNNSFDEYDSNLNPFDQDA